MAPDNNPQRITTHDMAPGTVVRLRNHIFVLVDVSKGPHQWLAARTGHYLSHEQFAARIQDDTVILFNPLDAYTNANTDTDTDRENNNDRA